MNEQLNTRERHPFIAALIGAAAGAAAVYFSDEKNRLKLKAKSEELMLEANKKRLQLENKILDARNKGKKTLVKNLKKTIEKIEE